MILIQSLQNYNNMALLLISFIAGVLTVLAPCILPVLPIIIGRSINGEDKYKPFIITGSLAVAVVVFTLLLKASTAFIDIPQRTWSWVSGTIIIVFGLISVFPHQWEKLIARFNFSGSSNQLLGKASQRKGFWGDVFVGLALGPVFSSCSPTYFLILATVLPQSYARGVLYLSVYALGLSAILLLIAFLGQRIVKKLNVLANPDGKFKKILGILFILVGIFIISGLDKKLQTTILDSGYFDITKVEQQLLQNMDSDEMDEMTQKDRSSKAVDYPKYNEIVNPSGFVNTDPLQLSDYVGEKVILLDFMTYSCINCQRTFPYLNQWYDTYKDQGLIVIGIHTPEFAFEQKRENVVDAAGRFGLEFPIVMDNDYATWRAYGNNFWPRKYLIDIHGNIVYDHIGEGEYDVTERKIQELLEERKEVLGEDMSINKTIKKPEGVENVIAITRTPETYVGSHRNSNLGFIEKEEGDIVTFSSPESIRSDKMYLVGNWEVQGEYSETAGNSSRILFNYLAQKVFLVMSAEKEVTAEIYLDGELVSDGDAGVDVRDGELLIQKERLYRLIESSLPGEHTLELRFSEPGVKVYAFTFG